MPNTTVQAAAEGLPKISRRLFLRNSTAVAVASAAGATIAVSAESAELTAEERFNFHLAEMQKAAEELDPLIGRWNVIGADYDDELGTCPIVISAHRITGRYEGDGTYEGGHESVFGKRIKYQVRLLPERVDGHRTFSVRTSMDRMVLPEPRLNTFIGRRVGLMEGGAA